MRLLFDHNLSHKLVRRLAAETGIQAAGGLVNTFMPGIGNMLALALGGLDHNYRQVRNRKVNKAVQLAHPTFMSCQGRHWRWNHVRWHLRQDGEPLVGVCRLHQFAVVGEDDFRAGKSALPRRPERPCCGQGRKACVVDACCTFLTGSASYAHESPTPGRLQTPVERESLHGA